MGNCIGEFSRKLSLITHAHGQLPYGDNVLHMNSYVSVVDCYAQKMGNLSNYLLTQADTLGKTRREIADETREITDTFTQFLKDLEFKRKDVQHSLDKTKVQLQYCIDTLQQTGPRSKKNQLNASQKFKVAEQNYQAIVQQCM